MGRAFEFAYRLALGDPDPLGGGGCDDRPAPYELASGRPDAPGTLWRTFALCPEHARQLAAYDARLVAAGEPSRMRPSPAR